LEGTSVGHLVQLPAEAIFHDKLEINGTEIK